MTDSRTGLRALRHTETPRGEITLGMTQQTTVLSGETSQRARNVHVTWTSCAEDRERERTWEWSLGEKWSLTNQRGFSFFHLASLTGKERIKGAASWHLLLLLLGVNLSHSFSWTSWLEVVGPVDPALPSSPWLSWLQNWYCKMFLLRRDAGFRVLFICVLHSAVQSFLKCLASCYSFYMNHSRF